MSSPMIFLLGLLVSLLNATGHSTRSAITNAEYQTLKMVQGRVSRRLEDLEPQLEALEVIMNAAPRGPDGQPQYTEEQWADVFNIQNVMRTQLEIADETRLRLNEASPEEDYGEEGFIPEERQHRDRVGHTRAGVSGIGRPKIGSQDPGVEAGNYRRTGIIINIQALGKKNHNGVAEPVGDIKLDHPVGTGPMQEGADGKYINVYFSNYRPGSKPMRKGDWVEFTVIQGKSSQDRPGHVAKPGRVMAGDVRKIGYMSNEERHTDYWKPFFQGTKVDHEGRSVVGQQTGTPYYKHPSNPKSMYSRSQYTRSQAGRARSSERGGARSDNEASGDERRPRSQERGFASDDAMDSDSPDERAAALPRQAPGLEVPEWRFDSMRERAAAVEAARRAAMA